MTFKIRHAVWAIGLAFFSQAGFAETSAQTPFTPAQQEAIGKIAADYLLAHPEILVQVSQKLQAQQAQEQASALTEGVINNQGALLNDKTTPAVGPAQAKVAVIEFFDYQCIYCNQMAPIVASVMKDNANVEVPTHLLLVQKNDHKETFSEEEELLLHTVEQQNEHGAYPINAYVQRHQELIMADEIAEGSNQYGKPARVIWYNGNMEDLFPAITEKLADDIEARFDRSRFEALQQQLAFERGELQRKTEAVRTDAAKTLTFLETPQPKAAAVSAQLGLFDAAPQVGGKAQAYLSDMDEAAVLASTARIISTIRTTDRPEHDSFLLLTAKHKAAARYLYKLYANVAEVIVSAKWLTGNVLQDELKALSAKYSNDHTWDQCVSRQRLRRHRGGWPTDRCRGRRTAESGEVCCGPPVARHSILPGSCWSKANRN